ncbi:MAG: pyruvate kinase [Chlamydiae bacterium]|nr:pyruvate kinase [Chlamydiota bacterium]
MSIRTKIICTMGPAVASYEKILELIDAGMNVARLNFSHGTHEDHLKVIEMLKKARVEKKVPLAIMLDTKGPEIRIGHVKPEGIQLAAGQKLKLVKNIVEERDDMVQMTPHQVFDTIKIGTKILIDDGYIITHVVDVDYTGITVEVENSAILKKNKGINIPNASINLPAMTQQDIDDISFGCKNGIDIVAASFIRSEDHVVEIKKLLISQGRPDVMLIAKIENPQGVSNFESIVQMADGIMVARGDLGVELPLQQVPALQKMMIKKCFLHQKPVVTATQMLESMIKNPRPTRAEVSDVANAIYDGSSAVMLSGETSVGLYPIETVRMMRDIIKESEANLDFESFSVRSKGGLTVDVSSAVSMATAKTAYNLQAKAIFVYTHSGVTARILSKCHPSMPILALSSSMQIYNQMSILWGVIPIEPETLLTEKESFKKLCTFILSRGLAHIGDLVITTSGSAFGISGSTNTMRVERIEAV